MFSKTVVQRDPAYNLYIRGLETMRINYGRMARSYGDTYLEIPDGSGRAIRDEAGKIKRFRGHPGPMPIDLRVYTLALQYDPGKRRFPEIIAELAKHKAEIHPFARRFLIERMRASEAKHRELAERYGAIADQFEIK